MTMNDDLGDDMAEGAPAEAPPTIVDAWLESLGDPPCGEDLEYDNDFLELTQAVAGKPGSQFAEPQPPDWLAVRGLSETLLDRTRDLRIAVMWGRAMLHVEGAISLPETLRLVHGLLDRHWDTLHPVPDDGDAYARVNVLTDMCSTAGLLGDLRAALVIGNRAIGELSGRDIAIALGQFEAREDESPPGKDQIEEMLRSAVADEPALGTLATKSLDVLERLGALMGDRVGSGDSPDLAPLVDAIAGIGSLMPIPAVESATDDAGFADADAAADTDSGASPTRRGSAHGLGDTIDTRADALRAIDMVCEFLERTEPTNPAQILLRRARRLVNKNFLELVREFAPDAVGEVARIMGVSADDLSTGSSDE